MDKMVGAVIKASTDVLDTHRLNVRHILTYRCVKLTVR